MIVGRMERLADHPLGGVVTLIVGGERGDEVAVLFRRPFEHRGLLSVSASIIRRFFILDNAPAEAYRASAPSRCFDLHGKVYDNRVH